jgi:hypothetical protein
VEVEVCVLPQTMSGNSNHNNNCGGVNIPSLPPHLLPPPNVEVLHAHLKSIWEYPKINKVSVELENGKIQKSRLEGDVDGVNLATRCSRLPMQQNP